MEIREELQTFFDDISIDKESVTFAGININDFNRDELICLICFLTTENASIQRQVSGLRIKMFDLKHLKGEDNAKI